MKTEMLEGMNGVIGHCGVRLRQARNRWHFAMLHLAAVILISAPVRAQVNVTTVQNDISRTGQNLNETILTPSNVNSVQFGMLFAQTVDGYIYAQPLYMSGLTIGGVTHNVVFVATQHDSVYAFDADSNSGANAAPLWQASLLSTSHGAAAGATTVPWPTGSDIVPEVGITGTPVIDPSTNTLYVVSATVEGSAQVQRLHALDVTTGSEKFGGPVVIAPSVSGSASDAVNGTLNFDPVQENQRPGLLLLNGIVYVGFASHEDHTPWHGWIVGFNAATLEQTGVFNSSPNGWGGGIWMSGAGLAADQLNPTTAPYGRMFVASGNGDYTASPPYGTSMDYGDSQLDLNLANGAPLVTDEFTTNGQAYDAGHDNDFGSGGVLILPTQTSGSNPNLLVEADKSGTIYLLNRDNLGGYNATQDQTVQELPGAVGDPGALSSPAYWNGQIYFWGQYDTLKAFSLTNGLLSTMPTAVSSETYGFPGATPAISANGTTQGIVWSINSEAYNNGPAVLQAHSASNVATTLYSSSTNANRDQAGPAVKFAIPTVANGKVYVGTGGALDVYGLLGTAVTTAATPSFSPVAGAYAGAQTVAISDATAGATIYYTTDGSTPTTDSAVYSAPISVGVSETLQAIAVENGYTPSAVGSAAYTISLPYAPSPTFSPLAGNYTSAPTVTISDAAAGATIYYTTDNSTPTTASLPYTGPISVNYSETIAAIALANGYATSDTSSASYTLNGVPIPIINDPSGFSSASGLAVVGTPLITMGALQLTSASGGVQTNAVWYSTPVSVQSFATDFYFQDTNATADGFTFTLQNVGLSAIGTGGGGGGLGYENIGSSVAVKFDLYDDAGEGINSTGFYTDGTSPTVPAVDMTPSGVNLHLSNILHAHLVYDGSTLTLTVTDTVTGDTFTTATTIDIPATVGASTAYVGFTAATGGLTATQSVLSWTYTPTSGTSVAATPTFSPATGSYSGTQFVTIGDATIGATIYYTTDGSTPTTSSAVYSAPISVSASETIQAIAVESGYTTSAVGSAAYVISIPATATPTFSPAAGSYSSTQSVTITDSTPGAVIYYTTDGSTPTVSSSMYSAAIPVNATTTINALATASGYSASAIATATYTIDLSAPPAAAVPTFSPTPGTYATEQTVTLNDSTPDATIYFTTDGSVPNPLTSMAYTAALQIGTTTTINAIAVASGYANSPEVTGTYTIDSGAPPAAATPTLDPAPGTYTTDQTIAVTDATPGAIIHYTLDGTTPSAASPEYTGPLSITSTTHIEAIAIASGFSTSAVGGGIYDIDLSATATPTFSPAPGSFTTAQTVTLSDATTGAVIYYTTDGSTPTVSSMVYSAPFEISATTTVQAIAVADDRSPSPAASATYTVTHTSGSGGGGEIGWDLLAVLGLILTRKYRHLAMDPSGARSQ